MVNGIMPRNYIVSRLPPTFHKGEEISFSGGNSRVFFAPSGQLIADIRTKKSTSHASEKELDKLWGADPYGLIHDLADIIHYGFVILIAGITSFVASYRRQSVN
jgi:hypothetical protein